MDITIIAAMTSARVIGKNNDLPWHYKEDLKHFKRTTLGKPMVMGRKTFESFGAKPLPRRQHIILSRNKNLTYDYKSVVVLHSINEVIEYSKKNNYSELMVIGGREIYQQFLPIATKMWLSFINRMYVGDTYFPVFDWNEWQQLISYYNKDFNICLISKKP